MANPIVPQTGGTPDPGDVVGRDELILRIVAACRNGTNFIISDPRRMGKTATLIRLCNEPGPGIDALLINLEGVSSITEIAERTFDAIRRHRRLRDRAGGVLKTFIEHVSVQAGPIKLSDFAQTLTPLVALERAFASIDDSLDDGELLIVALDEVTVAIENLCKDDPTEAALMLQMLRNLRGRQGSKIRWILTGSVGFHHVIRLAGATEGTLAEAESLDLGPLSSDNAIELAQRLFAGIDCDVDDAAVTRLIECTSGIPFLMHQTVASLRGYGESPSPGEVATAYESLIADRSKSAPATHLLTRIDGYYDDAALAKQVLDFLAIEGPASFSDVCAKFDTTHREVMLALVDDLTDDHYVQANLAWRYAALRDIWIARRRLK